MALATPTSAANEARATARAIFQGCLREAPLFAHTLFSAKKTEKRLEGQVHVRTGSRVVTASRGVRPLWTPSLHRSPVKNHHHGPTKEMKRLKLDLTSPRSHSGPQGGAADLSSLFDENQFSPARHGRGDEGGELNLGLVWRTSASDTVIILLHFALCHVPLNLEIALADRW